MEERRNIAYLVVILITSIAALAYLVMKIGNIGMGKWRTYYVLLDNTKGLAEKSDVRLGGVKVGYVDKMDLLLEENQIFVKTAMKIKPDVPIRKDFEVQIRMKSLLGEKYIELVPTGEGDRAEAEEGYTFTKTRVLFEPDELIMALKPFIDSLDPNAIKEISKAAPELVKNINPIINKTEELVNTVNTLLPETQRMLSKLYGMTDEFERIISIFSENSNEINEAIRAMPKLINNTSTVFSNVTTTIVEANNLLLTLREYQNSLTPAFLALPEMVSLSISILNFANSAIPEFQNILTQTSITLEKLQGVLEKGVKVRIF